MRPDSYFLTVDQIRSIQRKVVLFGAGKVSRDLISAVGDQAIGIVDNNPNMHGLIESGFEITSPERYLEATGIHDVFFVICTTSFTDVGEQLAGHGLVVGDDFCASPDLLRLLPVVRLQELEQRLLFTSGFRPSDNDRSGGGVYLLEIDRLDFEYRKIHSGTCHGMLQKDGLIYCVDQTQGIIAFNEELEVERTFDVAPGQRPHGIDWCEATGEYFVAASRQDCILVLDEQFREVDRIPLSDKFQRNNAPVHHINDLCIVDGSIYATMFSVTGNYHQDVFDGAIVEFDAADRRMIGPVMSGLWMPHNPKYLNGGLCVCDSLPGYLRRNNGRVAGDFPGFTRGLAADDCFYYVGQSRNRNFSNVLGVSSNISLDTAVIVFDDETKLSRSIPLDPRLSEVHAIEVLGPS